MIKTKCVLKTRNTKVEELRDKTGLGCLHPPVSVSGSRRRKRSGGDEYDE